MPKKKILFVHHTTAMGGATNSMLYNVLGIPKDKFEVKVLFLEKEKEGSKLFKERGIEVDYLEGIAVYQHGEGAKLKWVSGKPLKPITQFIRMLKSVSKVEKYLDAHPVDMVYSNTSLLLPVGLAAKRKGIKHLWHVREQLADGVIGVRKRIVRNIITKNADRIIAISKENALRLHNPRKGEVIYNFVDFKIFNKEIAKDTIALETSKSTNTQFITMLGGVIHSKGADVFIKAVPLVLEKHPDTIFVIAGYPPVEKHVGKGIKVFIKKLLTKNMSKECLRLIQENSLEEKVKFVGLRKDIPQVIASSKILVWPGTTPHFARPIIEAQAMAVPPIGSDYASTREIIKDEETGLVFRPLDYRDLAKKIDTLLSNKELYNTISQKGYEQAIEKFNSENNLKKLTKVIQKLSED